MTPRHYHDVAEPRRRTAIFKFHGTGDNLGSIIKKKRLLSIGLSWMFLSMTAVLALDQGTSGTRCFIVDYALNVLGHGAVEIGMSHPRPGWVQQDPFSFLSSAADAAREALEMSGLKPSDIAGMGIANQTETFIVWDRTTGDPIYPAISWQCRRSTDRYERLARDGYHDLIRSVTGLQLDPAFPATKLGWVLDNVDGARDAAADGALASGDVACWLLWNLTDGRVHVTESSNASRTMLVNLATLDWDPELLELFDIPVQVLPEIVASDGMDHRAMGDPWNDVPIRAMLGDQQAALFGQQCWDEGMAKLTLGTGAFLWENAGNEVPQPPEGILATCAWRFRDRTTYALEGFVPSAGSVVEWLRWNGFVSDPSEADVAMVVEPDDPHLCFVPALQGLGSPVWDAEVRGLMMGISASTSSVDMVRAALDGVAQLISDAVEAIGMKDRTIRVDGGMSSNDGLMQRIADLTGVPCERPARQEATGMGIASLTGLACGLWDTFDELRDLWELDRRFQPSLAQVDRDESRARWKRAVDLAREWVG
ncbi:MAG: glycerol kinase GlpK [Actinobacteria bacterium]|nr:glycerol kinase GlpK [Actinomycetota bacterium]